MADNFNMKQFLVENKLGAYSRLKEEEVEEAKKEVSKEQKIQVIKEWIWYVCDEGQAKDDVSKYNKMIDMYFANKEDVTKEDFKKIYSKVIEKWGVGDVGADWESFEDDWKDVQRGKLVNPEKQYEAKLNEYEVTYEYGSDGSCYRVDDEGNYDEVDDSYCRRYAGQGVREDKKEVEEIAIPNEDAGGIESDIEQDLMYTEDPILYLKSIIDFCTKKIGEIEQSGSEDSEMQEAKKEEIKEALTPEMFERMDAVTSTRAQIAMIKAAEIMMNELTEEGFEVLDIREYFTQLIANDI